MVIMSVIGRPLMVLTSRFLGERDVEYQFKDCIMALATEAAILVPDDPQRAIETFTEILDAIARVQYYRAKRPPNKWCLGRREKLSNA